MLFIREMEDNMITSEILGIMGVYVPDLTIGEVNAGHWLLWKRSADANASIAEWMEQQGLISSVATSIEQSTNNETIGDLTI